MPKYQDEPERGSREHAIITTLRNHREELGKITDPKVHGATIDAMVRRIDDYDKQHDAIADELGPRIRALEARYDPLPKNDPQRAPLEKQLVAVNRVWHQRLAPLSKALHRDLDNIVEKAVEPYRARERALAKNVQTVGKNLRSRQLAEAFRDRQAQNQPGKDRDHER
jgi:hypothetical protein